MRPPTALLAASLLAPCARALWPAPTNYTLGSDVLWLAPDVRILMQMPHGAPTMYAVNATPADASGPATDNDAFAAGIVQTAVAGMMKTVFEQGFVPWKFHPRNSAFEPPTTNKAFISSITLAQTGPTPANISRPASGVDESYSLALSPGGAGPPAAAISAATPLGLARGLTTFSQLFYAHTDGGAYTPFAPASAHDAPTFPHRGLNMDVSRNYYAPADVERTIDALAFAKMNRLHLHITDAQSWPLVVPALPALAAAGAYSPGLVYTPATLRALQQFGALRGVQVYIETDMPGHTSSVALAYPDLVAAFNVQPDWPSYCAEPPCGTLRLNDSAVGTFVDALLDDVLPRVAEFSTAYHTGGDEVNFNAYTLDPSVGTNSSAVITPLLQAFFERTHAAVAQRAGLVQIVWEEMLLMYNLTLPTDVVVQSWQSDAAVAAIVAKGHRAIAGNYDFWYMDCGHGDWTNFPPGDASQAAFPYVDYCAPLHNWRVMYAYDPLASVPADKQGLVVGGEASIWSEQTDGVSLDTVIWPRLGAAAEVLWAGAKDPATGMNRSQVEAAPRLSEFRERLVARGVSAATVQMPFCTQNGSQCTLD